MGCDAGGNCGGAGGEKLGWKHCIGNQSGTCWGLHIETTIENILGVHRAAWGLTFFQKNGCGNGSLSGRKCGQIYKPVPFIDYRFFSSIDIGSTATDIR
jgi:hypothetical protein